MKTTVMFVSDSEPLAGAPVRMPGAEELYVTDSEGKVQIDLDLGTHTFEVQVGETWTERTVNRQGHAPLFVVNIQPASSNLSTLNTLQIDLSNLVGDRYVFETVLGRGGMGVVVKAIDRMLNRPVAVKLLSEELRENEEAQQIFLVEARNLATLSHPNLVAIHDILNVGGRVLMVFEYVLGENIERKIKKGGRLTQKEVLRVAIQLTRCVSYLHEHDLIHRDLKPANIIMQGDGTLKLIDFGLARSLNELYIRGTRVRGTPAYMAPEQVQGIHLTTSTDLYQIGISMYEMLTGKLPFPTGDMAYAHVHLEPPPIRENHPEIDEELAALVAQCLEKNWKHRPSSADELLERLQSIYARLVSHESDPFQKTLTRTVGAPIPTAGPAADHVVNARSSLSESSAALEYEEELDSSSNRLTLAVAGIGVVALLVTGFLLLTRSPTSSPGAASSPESAAVVPSEVSAMNAEEPNPDVLESMRIGRTRVRVSTATAAGRAAGIATVDVEQEAATPVKRAPARKPRKPSKPSAAAKADDERKEPVAVPTTPKQKRGGLLSVDAEGTKSLLPVTP